MDTWRFKFYFQVRSLTCGIIAIWIHLCHSVASKSGNGCAADVPEPETIYRSSLRWWEASAWRTWCWTGRVADVPPLHRLGRVHKLKGDEFPFRTRPTRLVQRCIILCMEMLPFSVLAIMYKFVKSVDDHFQKHLILIKCNWKRCLWLWLEPFLRLFARAILPLHTFSICQDVTTIIPVHANDLN
jgi:hypothetical protein